MSEKLKAMRGSEERFEEVRGWLKSQGATDLYAFACKDSSCLYFVGSNNEARCIDDGLAQLVDIVELSEKPAVSFKPFDKVLVRDNETDEWTCDFYSYHDDVRGLHTCIGGMWCRCIPYEGNEHLVGKVR